MVGKGKQRWMNTLRLFQVGPLLSVAATAGAASLEAPHRGHTRIENELEIDAVPGNTASSIDSESAVATNHSIHKTLECGIWLAPSAIEGAGLGMYAGRDFKEGEMMQEIGDLCIPIVDLKHHNANENHNFGPFLWDQYTWSASALDADQEGMHETNGASAGFGSTANSFLPLVNVEELSPHRNYAGLHRSKDPGAGAFSPYYDRGSEANRDIAAGEELYVSYGEEWFKGREYLGPIPLTHDFDKATKLFKKYTNLKRRVGHSMPASVFEDLWESFIKESAWKDSSRVFGSFHHNDAEEMALLEKLPSLKDLRIRQATRSQEWLEEHGTCADHIRGGDSTLPQAGHGAFATRDIPEGTIVAQVPLIHIIDRSRFNMYNLDEEDLPNKDAGRRPPQLMLNYCYGHNESTVLLCPYGPVVNLINHNQTETNVKIQWADPKRGNFMPHLLDDQLSSLHKDPTAKLAFQLIATRPIREGEEVFLDYGASWENAWQKHIKSWSPVDGASDYNNADELNEMLKNDLLDLPTEFERIEKELPSFQNVMLACNNYFSDDLWRADYYNGKLDDSLELHEKTKVEYLYCNILRKHKDQRTGDILYTVEARSDDDDRNFIWEAAPKSMLHFLDEPYGTDMFLQNAFRHDIRIPDEMFPEKWRNLSPDFVKESNQDGK